LKNLPGESVAAFKEQVRLIPMIGENDPSRIAQAIADCHAQQAPPFGGAVADIAVETVRAKEPRFYKSDPAGFFVLYPERRSKELVVEHYTSAGVLDCVVVGTTPTALYAEIVERHLVGQLDHAAYLGRELASAENCGPACTSCR
jgi:tetrahydromethanopterin S-methyltransferase subunit A